LLAQGQEQGSAGGSTIDAVRMGELLAVLVDNDNITYRDNLLEKVAWKLAELFECAVVTVDTVTETGQLTVAYARFGLHGVPPDEDIHPLGLRTATMAGRAAMLDECGPLPPHLAERGIRGGVCVPFVRGSAVLSLYRARAEPFTVSEVDLIEVMGRYLMLVLRRVQRVAQMAQLAEHSARVGECRSEREVLDVAVDGVMTLMGADAAGVGLIADGVVSFTTHRGFPADFDGWKGPLEELSVAAAVVRDKKTVRSVDIRTHAPDRSLWPVSAAVIAPVELDGVVGAVLAAYHYAPVDFTADDEYVLKLLAGQVAAAMTNARLVETAERGRRTAESLRGLSAALNASLSVTEIGERLCAVMAMHADADRVALLLLDEDRQRLVPICAQPEDATDFLVPFRGVLGTIGANDTACIAQALRERRPVMQVLGEDQPAEQWHWLGVWPLEAKDGNVGVVLLEWDTQTQPDLPDEVLDTIAEMAASALAHAQLFERAERSGMQLAALHDVAAAITTDDDISATLSRIVESARELTSAEVARIGLVDGSGDAFTTVAISGKSWLTLGASMPMDRSVGAWATQHGQTAWVPDTAAGVSEPPDAAAWIYDRSPGSAVAVPVRGRTGVALGFLTLRHSEPYFLARSCMPVLERFAIEAGLAVENRRELEARRSLSRQLREQASHDPLTGLANRPRLLEMISRALAAAATSRPESTLAVLFLDLDRFKTINDSLGHAAGDELLCALGNRLTDAVRPGDVVGRLGGDEFVLLLDGLARETAATEAEIVAERILVSLAEPMTIRGRPVFISASIGVAVAAGHDRDADDLLRDADIAMYRAKAAGKAQVVLFEPSMSIDGLLDMESDLRQALDDQLLLVHYQPIVDLATGKALGFEALARWPHPTLGWVPPVEFVALAEETGLVRRLDQWVLETALRDLHRVHEEWPELEVNVNLSAVHLHEGALPARIARTLEASGVRPEMLTLEITETAAMWDPSRTLDTLNSLRALGIGVVLDDFGTGYSNFGYLKRLPLRGLKIDHSFVERVDVDQQDAAIGAALITLSQSLGLDVIAEGVETREQQQRLLELGCRRAQGWFFSRAMPFDELLIALREDDQR
jgi:diguanylate cyclase (GGDEF)-like protein